MSVPATKVHEFAAQGYTIARGLFGLDEVEALREHFFRINEEERAIRERDAKSDNIVEAGDPLAQYPRVMQPHRFDQKSLQWMIDARLNAWMTAILGREPYAVQTMFYFKPPGARGQALHQDQFYLRVDPGTCVAAWMAVDHCDEDNGCLRIVPGTHDIPVLCAVEADTGVSFTDVTVELPPGYEPIPLVMDPGDVLFFNGQLVHGSYPNRTIDRFRCALIGHYIVGGSRGGRQMVSSGPAHGRQRNRAWRQRTWRALRRLGRARWRADRRPRSRRHALRELMDLPDG